MLHMRKLLCVRRGGLGDTLLMVPILRAMRARAGLARITFAGVEEFARVLLRYGVVDGVCSSETLGLWSLALQNPAAMHARARLAAFDWIVGDDPALAAVASAQCRVDVFDPRLDAGPQQPAAAQLLSRAGLRGRDDVSLVAQRPLPRTGATIVVHAGSGSLTKCWPRTDFAALVSSLATSWRVRVVAGPAEIERGTHTGWSTGVDVVTPASVEALADEIERARVFVGYDSGPTHLAAALRVPTIALFTTTNPGVWAPVGEHVHAVSQPPSANTIERVVALVQGLRA